MTEGNPNDFFLLDRVGAVSNEQEEAAEVEVLTLEGLEYDIQRLRAEGYGIDDDNEPAPENTPAEAESGGDHATYGEWVSLEFARDVQSNLVVRELACDVSRPTS